MEKDSIFQGTSILGSMDYRPSTPMNNYIMFGIPQHHARGTMTMSWDPQVEEPKQHFPKETSWRNHVKKLFLNVHTIKDKP